MGTTRDDGSQQSMWLATADLPQSAGHPFYERLNRILEAAGFDAFVEGLCAPFYAVMGRPSPAPAPGRYFRLLLIGYFEGLDSERGIAWRAEDSLSMRAFLRSAAPAAPPTIRRSRGRVGCSRWRPITRCFTWVLEQLAASGLVAGKTLGVDATTLEANAAMRSIVRRDTGEDYTAFLTHSAKASGIETPTAEELARFDRKRKKKTSHKDWTHPHDPDAKVAKMKDGSTHLPIPVTGRNRYERRPQMLTRTLVTGAALLVFALPCDAQEPAYSRAEIEAAIEIGVRDRVDRIQHACHASVSGFWNKLGEAMAARQSGRRRRKFRITGQPPMARVARYAGDARRRDEPTPQATDDHIVAMTADDVFTVWIVRTDEMFTAVEHVVIRPRGDGEGRFTVQPLTIDVAGSESATNLFGASVELQGVVATFASADVIAIVEDNDVEVILMTTGGEFKCNLDDTRIKRGYNPLDD